MESSLFVTNSELTSYINNSLSQLDDILISKFNDYKLAQVILSTVNTNQIPLPADFVKLRGVDVFYDASTPDGYYECKKFSFQHRNKRYGLYGNGVLGTPWELQYRLQDQYIIIEPAAVAAQWSYRISYTPGYVQFVWDGYGLTNLQPYMDTQAWCEYAIVDSAIKVLEKQDLDPSIFMAQKEELKEHIIKLATPGRDNAEPASVVDTRGWHGGLGGNGWF